MLCGTRERVAVSTTVRFRHRVAFWALSAASISAHDGARQTCSSPFVVMDPRRLPSGENAVRNKTAAWPRSGRVGWRCEQFRPMASCVSALSSIVANGHQVLPSFPPPPLFIPYGGFSRILCGVPHNMRYVANSVMWREVRAGRLGGPLAFFDAT